MCLKQTEKTTATAYEKPKAEMASVTEHVSQVYSNLIAKKARQPWTKIMTAWTDLQGVEPVDQLCKSWDSFMECMRLHLLTVLHNDAAEIKRYYIINCLKKPK